MQRLAELGVRLSLDDFGTGYSSLVYLKRLPIHEIKVDRSFVKTLPADPDASAIVRSAIGLGHNLGLRVIAEGVEDRDAEAMLVEAGCDARPGLLHRPPGARGRDDVAAGVGSGDDGRRRPRRECLRPSPPEGRAQGRGEGDSIR